MYNDSEDERTTKLTCDVRLHRLWRRLSDVIYIIYIYIYIYICNIYIQKHRDFAILAFVGRIHLFPSQRTSDAGVFRFDDVIMNVEFCIDIPILADQTWPLDQFAIKSVVFCVWILLQNQYEIKCSMLPAKCALPCTKITWTEWLHIHICVCMDKMCNISRRNMLQVWYQAALASYQCDNKTHVFFSNNYKHYVYTAHLQVQKQ